MTGAGDEHPTEDVWLEALGLSVRLCCQGAEAALLAAAMRASWDRCLVPAPGDGADADPAIELTRTLDDPEGLRRVMDELSTRITQDALALRVGEWWLLHACALADPATGATVVLVAPSGTGKTTAARTLGRRWAYLTDETAAIDPEGRLTPYPKPLSLLVDGRRPKDQVSPSDLELLPAVPEPYLAAVALLDRDPGMDGVEVTDVRTVEGLPLLAEQTSSLHLLPQPLHLVAGMLARTGGLRRIRYAEASDLHDVVADLLGVAS